MKLNVQKFKDGGQSKKVEATFGLPEVNIYPQNEFGDIARSQGINRARNWKKVKEGTTKGINDFYNDPRTQMVMAGLPLPSMLDAAGDAIKVVGPIIKNSKVFKNASKTSNRIVNNLSNIVKSKTTKTINNNLIDHIQGDEAIKMFKEYGGTKPSIENSPLMHRMQRYVPEARERYGIVGNTNITDEEIAGSLYKQANQISQPGNKAVNSKGEPLVLFRGDTKRYENLRPPSSPEEVAKETWTMDNALGTLYLGDLPNPKGEGLDRYLVTQRFGGIEGLNSSATGSKYVVPKGIDRSMPLPGSRLLTQRNAPHGASDYIFKVPSKYVESGVNDINAFVVNSKGLRDATDEISVFFDDALSKKQNFKGVPNDNSRESIAKHYQNVLDDAKIKNQGLLKSNKKSQLRDEHDYYDFYALPKFNHNNIKHILPYDMRIPRNFKDPNIYKSLIGGAFLNNLINNLKKEHMK